MLVVGMPRWTDPNPVVIRPATQRRPFVDYRCVHVNEAGRRCLQTAQPDSDRCGLTGHGWVRP